MKNKPLIEPTSYSLSQTLSPVSEPAYIVELSETQPDGGPLLTLNDNSYGTALCDKSYDNNITINYGNNTFARCKKNSSGGYIDCYDISNNSPSSCCSNYDPQGLAYLFGEKETNTLTCSVGPPPKYGYNILTSQCELNGKDGSKNTYSSNDLNDCNAAYRINADNEIAQKINFPPIPPFNNKNNDYSILTSPYYRYSKEFYNVSQGTSSLINIYLMTEIASMTACWGDKPDQNGLYAVMDCSQAITKNGINFAPCSNGTNVSWVGLGNLSKCTSSWPGCSGKPNYTSDDTRTTTCGHGSFAYGKFGYVSNDVENHIYNGFTVLPNLINQPAPQPFQFSIVPVMGYESKDGGKTYVLTKDPRKIKYYCIYKIQIGIGSLFTFYNNDNNNYPVKFQMYDPTDWVNNATKYSACGLFAFSTIPNINNPQKVGLVAVNPSVLNNSESNYENWDLDGNLDDVTDKSEMNLANQVYPFLDNTQIKKHYGWLSFINAPQLLGIRGNSSECCGTISGASYLWVQQDPGNDENFNDKIVSGYTRTAS